jgi:hypothetical protein
MRPTTLTPAAAELDPVQQWRLQELVRAGYPPYEALLLSRRSDVDLHEATRLVRRGCPARTAARILL